MYHPQRLSLESKIEYDIQSFMRKKSVRSRQRIYSETFKYVPIRQSWKTCSPAVVAGNLAPTAFIGYTRTAARKSNRLRRLEGGGGVLDKAARPSASTNHTRLCRVMSASRYHQSGDRAGSLWILMVPRWEIMRQKREWSLNHFRHNVAIWRFKNTPVLSALYISSGCTSIVHGAKVSYGTNRSANGAPLAACCEVRSLCDRNGR